MAPTLLTYPRGKAPDPVVHTYFDGPFLEGEYPAESDVRKYSEDQPRDERGRFAGYGDDPYPERSDLSKSRIDLVRNNPTVLASHDWPETKPWQLSAADIAAGKAPGIRAADLGSGTGNDTLGTVHGIDKAIIINSQTWDSVTPEQRADVLYHELGHIVTATIDGQRASDVLAAAGRTPFEASSWGSRAQYIDPRGEELAYLYGDLVTSEPRTEQVPGYNEETHTGFMETVPVESDAAARDLVFSEARYLGAPAETQIVRFGPNAQDLTKYSEAQPRDERGRWTSDGGGGIPAEGKATEWPHFDGSRDQGHSPIVPEQVDITREELEQGTDPHEHLEAQAVEQKDVVSMALADRLGDPASIKAMASSPGMGTLLSSGLDYASDRAARDEKAGVPGAADQRLGEWERQWPTATPEERAAWLENPYARYAIAAGYLSSWANTSSDGDAVALAIQMAAAKEFGLDVQVTNRDGTWTPGGVRFPNGTVASSEMGDHGPLNSLRLASGYLSDNEAGIRALLGATYANTQEQLAAKGITEMTVTRGVTKLPAEVPTEDRLGLGIRVMANPDGWSGQITSNPLSSWTLDRSVARGFGDTHLTTTVPASRIFSTAGTGLGSLPEREVVLLGGPTNVLVDRKWA